MSILDLVTSPASKICCYHVCKLFVIIITDVLCKVIIIFSNAKIFDE